MDRLVEISFDQKTASLRAKPVEGSDAAARLLAIFLKLDLQSGARSAREVIERLDDVANGRKPSWSRNGNSFLLTVLPQEISLQDHDADDGEVDHVVLPAASFRLAVSDWLAALEHQASGAAGNPAGNS